MLILSFFSLLSQGRILVKNYWSKENLGYLNNKKWSKQQKWMSLTGYFLPQKFNGKPTLRDIPFQVTNKWYLIMIKKINSQDVPGILWVNLADSIVTFSIYKVFFLYFHTWKNERIWKLWKMSYFLYCFRQLYFG